MSKAPYIQSALIEHLEDKFPLRDILKADTQDQLWFHKGIRHVIDYLNSLKDHQDKTGNILNVQP